jgi:hypothetical protein
MTKNQVKNRSKFAVGNKVRIVRRPKSLVGKIGQVKSIDHNWDYDGYVNHCVYQVKLPKTTEVFYLYSWELQRVKG